MFIDLYQNIPAFSVSGPLDNPHTIIVITTGASSPNLYVTLFYITAAYHLGAYLT